MSEENEGLEIISPEEVNNLKKEHKVVRKVNPVQQDVDTIPNVQEKDGYLLPIEYSSMGKFSIPPIVRWKGYDIDAVTDLTLTSEDEFMNDLVGVLNKMKQDDFRIEESLLEEFIETLIYLKIAYDSTGHNHPWQCDNKDCEGGINVNDRENGIRKLCLIICLQMSLKITLDIDIPIN
jgi:hypothetical protein